MTKFIENVNAYLASKSIKQTYVSMQSGIDVKKLSRILTGVQDVTGSDMEKISHAVGKDISFFLSANFSVSDTIPEFSFLPSSYSEGVSKSLENYTAQLVEFLQNVDEVLSAKKFLCPPIGG